MTTRDDKPSNVKKYIKYMIENNEKEKFKFYRLIEKGNYQDISDFLNIIYKQIVTITNKEENNIYLIGILRSGSFLSHALKIISLNISDNKINLDDTSTYFFITFPYLSILPRKIEIRENNIYFFIDEAIKTGYSLGLASRYLKRTIMLKNKDIDLKKIKIFSYSIVNFKNYESNREATDYESHSLVDLSISNKENELKFEINPESIKAEETIDWKSVIDEYSDKIYETDKDSLNNDFIKKIMDTSKIKINNEDRLDIVKIISDSENLFKICLYFAKDILKIQDLNNKTLIFYPGSPEGKLIADVVAFLLKIIHGDNNKTGDLIILLNGKLTNIKKKKNPFLIFTDLSYISGRTEKNTFKLDVNDKIEGIEDFNKIYVIYSQIVKDNIISLFNKETVSKDLEK